MSWFGLSPSADGKPRNSNKDQKEALENCYHSAFRRRADEGATFTASKCPHDSCLENSCELPFGFVWTPMAVYNDKQSKSRKNMPSIQCDSDELPPVLCLACLTYINPFAEMDYSKGIWNCPLCGQENAVSKEDLRYGSNVMTALKSACVEYRQACKADYENEEKKDDEFIANKRKYSGKSNESEEQEIDYCTYLLVVDENLPPKDGQAITPVMESILKEHCSRSTGDKISRARIGLVVFGRSVSMFQLGLSGLASADVYMLNDPTVDDDEEFNNIVEKRAYLHEVQPGENLTSLRNSLSSVFGVAVDVNDTASTRTLASGTISSRIAMLSRKKEVRLRKENDKNCNINLDSKSPWVKRREESLSGHPKRCTGDALQCALDLVSATTSKPSRTSRILLFTNGCPNTGDGNVVTSVGVSAKSKKLKGKRPTHDIVDINMLQKAVEYFDTTANFAVSVGIGIDVFCCGVTELALPAYQAMVEPSGGYVLPHVSFDTLELQRNLKFVLENTYMSKSQHIPEDIEMDVNEGAECILDIRTDSFVTPSQMCGPGKILTDVPYSEMVENEKSAFDKGAKIAEDKGFNTKKFPCEKAIELSMTRLQMGRVDPLSTVTVLMEIDDSISEDDEYAFFQLVSRYISVKGNEQITRVCSFRIPVAENVNDFLKSVDDDAMSVVLAKVAVYRSLHGRDETDDIRDPTAVGDISLQEKLAYDTQLDLDATIQRISGAFRLVCLEEKTRSVSKSPRSSKKTSQSSLDFAFPPQMRESLDRLYHLRRGPLISPGPMQSMDDRAESRGLFLRFPLEDCLQMIRPAVFSTGSIDGISSPWDIMVPFPAETLALWDDSVVAADFHDILFVWSGANCLGSRYDGIREKFKTQLLKASENRFPMPEIFEIDDGDSMSRRFTARLEPSHADSMDNQIVHFPELSSLTSEALEKLRSKFRFYDSKSDASFRAWFWSVASASNSSRLDGVSLCE